MNYDSDDFIDVYYANTFNPSDTLEHARCMPLLGISEAEALDIISNTLTGVYVSPQTDHMNIGNCVNGETITCFVSGAGVCAGEGTPADESYYSNCPLPEDTAIAGCTDSEACNYIPEATVDDGSCEYVIDCNGVCGGSEVEDCSGDCGGTKIVDL